MTRFSALVASLLVILIAIATPALSEKRVALVIGNSTYQRASRLPNPVNDAADIAVVLERLGFAVRKETDLDFNGMRRALRDFGSEAAGADMAAIFFAGHGLELGGQNFLVPVDAQLQTDRDVALEAIPLDYLLTAVEGARGLRLVLLDACRNNPFAVTMSMTSATRALGRGLSRVDPAGGTLVGFAAKGGTEASDGQGRNSPYTAALLARLQEPGVEIRLLFGKIRDDVLAATGRAQEPFVYGSLGGEAIYLVPPVDPGSQGDSAEQPPIRLPQPLADPVPDTIAADYSLAERIGTKEAWEAFLRRHGSDKANFHVQLAEAALKKLAVGTFAPVDALKTEEPTSQPRTSHRPGDTFKDCDVCPELVVVPAGTFTMGSPAAEPGRRDSEGPQHTVAIAQAFAVGKFEVKRGEFAAFVAATGYDVGDRCHTHEGDSWEERTGRSWKAAGIEQTDDHPVVCVSWNDAKAYLAWLSKKAGVRYRLLSEAEWEYVARAGTATPFTTGKTISADQANFDGSSPYNGSRKGKWRKKTTPVGTFAMNPFGLHDLHGNVWEWLEDCWNDSHRGGPSDGTARATGDCSTRVLRGGSWFYNAVYLRSAVRSRMVAGNRSYDLGFRVARPIEP